MNNEFRSQLRKFVKNIRQTLIEEGHDDIMIRPFWLEERDAGDLFDAVSKSVADDMHRPARNNLRHHPRTTFVGM